jgi:hypothetical protein
MIRKRLYWVVVFLCLAEIIGTCHIECHPTTTVPTPEQQMEDTIRIDKSLNSI